MFLGDWLRRSLNERHLNRERRLLDRASLVGREPIFPGLVSQICTAGQVRSPEYIEWTKFLKCPNQTRHRKVWEFCYIAQLVREQVGFREGLRCLGFGVGQDCMSDAFAALGCTVVASDQAPENAARQGWLRTDQYSATLQGLNRLEICEPERFRERVTFRVVDMNDVPGDLRDFDFLWSACAFEHLGSIELGLRFVERAMASLRPGGWAIHTTEFNLTSNSRTLEKGGTVLFRKRDIERLFAQLERQGHRPLPLNLHPGTDPIDRYIDVPPYGQDPHLRLQYLRHTTTSIGIAIQRAP